jgi:hypothetical protein
MYSHGWIFTLLSNRYFVQQCTRKCVKPMYYLIIERKKKKKKKIFAILFIYLDSSYVMYDE